MEEVGNYLAYATADGGSKWTELIAILRGESGGEGPDTPTPSDDGSNWEDGVPYADLGLINNTSIKVSDGTLMPGTNWSSTEFLPCKGASKIGSFGNMYSSKYGAWYDAQKHYIGGWTTTLNTSTSVTESFVDVPNDACWFRWSTSNTSFQNEYFKLIPHA